jgi:single-strand DNA-binding protein
MAGISKIILIGNLGRDPETRYTPSGTMNVNFSLAVSRRFRDSQGQDQEKTNWFRVTAWGRLAETLDGLTQRGYVGKGRQVYVEGRLDLNEYNDRETNEKRYSLDVYATEFQLIGNRGDSGGEDYGGRSGGAGAGTSSGRSGNTDYGENEGSMDDVPF